MSLTACVKSTRLVVFEIFFASHVDCSSESPPLPIASHVQLVFVAVIVPFFTERTMRSRSGTCVSMRSQFTSSLKSALICW